MAQRVERVGVITQERTDALVAGGGVGHGTTRSATAGWRGTWVKSPRAFAADAPARPAPGPAAAKAEAMFLATVNRLERECQLWSSRLSTPDSKLMPAPSATVTR